MKEVTIDGKQIARGRLQIVNRAIEILTKINPNLDWNTSELVLSVKKK